MKVSKELNIGDRVYIKFPNQPKQKIKYTLEKRELVGDKYYWKLLEKEGMFEESRLVRSEGKDNDYIGNKNSKH